MPQCPNRVVTATTKRPVRMTADVLAQTVAEERRRRHQCHRNQKADDREEQQREDQLSRGVPGGDAAELGEETDHHGRVVAQEADQSSCIDGGGGPRRLVDGDAGRRSDGGGGPRQLDDGDASRRSDGGDTGRRRSRLGGDVDGADGGHPRDFVMGKLDALEKERKAKTWRKLDGLEKKEKQFHAVTFLLTGRRRRRRLRRDEEQQALRSRRDEQDEEQQALL